MDSVSATLSRNEEEALVVAPLVSSISSDDGVGGSSSLSTSPSAHLLELWQDEAASSNHKSLLVDELDELDLLSEEGIIQEEWLLGSHPDMLLSSDEDTATTKTTNGGSTVHCISPSIAAAGATASSAPMVDCSLLEYGFETMDEVQWQQQQQYESPSPALPSSLSSSSTTSCYPSDPLMTTQVVQVVEGKAVFSSQCETTPPSNKRRKVSLPNSRSSSNHDIHVNDDDDYIPSMSDLVLPATTSRNNASGVNNNNTKVDPVSAYLDQRLQSLLHQFQVSYASVMESKRILSLSQQQQVTTTATAASSSPCLFGTNNHDDNGNDDTAARTF